MQMARQMREREEGARRQETRERTQNSAESEYRVNQGILCEWMN